MMMSWLVLLSLSVAQAGFLKMVGEPHLEIKKENQKLYLVGEYKIINQGDEEALDVFPELDIDEFHWQGDPESLKAKEGAKWAIHEELKPLCVQASDNCPVVFPDRGEFMVKVRKHYKDLNSYAFVIPDLFIVDTSKDSLETPMVQAQMKIKSPESGQSVYQAEYTLKNQSDEKLKVWVTPLFPAEVKLLNTALPIEIPPQGEVEGQFEFQNEKGLPNSNYVGLLSAEWAQKDQRFAVFAYSTFQIEGSKKTLSRWTLDQLFLAWWLWAIGLGLIAMWTFWIRPLKKLDH